MFPGFVHCISLQVFGRIRRYESKRGSIGESSVPILAKVRGRTKKIAAVAMFAGSIGLLCARPLCAGSAPTQRGEFVPPGAIAASIVKLCGLAVMLIVQPHDGKATLYAGEAMRSKLKALRIGREAASSYELADFYNPIDASCRQIRADHERLLGTQLKD